MEIRCQKLLSYVMTRKVKDKSGKDNMSLIVIEPNKI